MAISISVRVLENSLRMADSGYHVVGKRRFDWLTIGESELFPHASATSKDLSVMLLRNKLGLLTEADTQVQK